ncbi:SH3 domain-containing kinase-binding protein 1-like [Xenentodon cancila]
MTQAVEQMVCCVALPPSVVVTVSKWVRNECSVNWHVGKMQWGCEDGRKLHIEDEICLGCAALADLLYEQEAGARSGRNHLCIPETTPSPGPSSLQDHNQHTGTHKWCIISSKDSEDQEEHCTAKVEAVVEFDYEAQQDDELSLTVGDIIVNIRRDDGGWWEGELGGRRGLFPDNFVREIKKDGKRDGGQAGTIRSELSNGSASPVSDGSVRPGKKGEQIRKRRCKAAFSYVPQHEDELELKVGDVIEVIAEVEEGWWEGILNGKAGMFPSNFTKEILTETDTPCADTPTSQEELRSRNSKDSPGSESDGGDSRSETGSEIQPKKVINHIPI